MTTPKLLSAEDIVAKWYTEYTHGRDPINSDRAYSSVLVLVKATRNAVLEAAAEMADKIEDRLQHGSGPHEVPWTVAIEIAAEIRRLKDP